MQRAEDSLRDLWDHIKCTNTQVIGVPEEEEKKKVYEKVFEEIIVENFPISSSFIWTCVSSLSLHLCSISVPFHFIYLFFKLLCLRSPFARLQGKESWILSLKKFEFFLPFGFCPPKVCPVVFVSFIQGEICAEFSFVCITSDEQGWVRW